ncbi:hypothetical protein BDZ90DRAFT_259146 [Jaminaea rosea]|uniref:RED-like N-terminal domain-containing protein n=1 Tax=Jaminaea rosea TaxID=1569628 RepID=A0A316UUY5_9BASI|nr:hypothetical protein BDZ90DRAFT_259146 [Jaminaea rosea]PWN29089.1 hypothetical protein BDZ90DRAFT_259146 [Jaminaea rosea]
MDQEAFRSLLSSSGASSSSGAPRAAFGSTQKRPRPRPQAALSQHDDDDYRKHRPSQDADTNVEDEQPKQRGPKWNSATGEAYVDRAAARREGREPGEDDEEAASVRALHEEWRQKWLAADTEEQRREVEEQMAFLGGDAKHSILVKGLDYALLAQQRAKAGGARGEEDDDLEQAYAGARQSPGEAESSKSSASSAKRSRQEILDALKRRKLDRGDASSPPQPQLSEELRKQREAEEERQRHLSKFKPIGAGTSGQLEKVIITKDGKRLRKKVKKPADGPTANGAREPVKPAATIAPSNAAVSSSSAPSPSSPSSRPAVATKPAPPAPLPSKRDFAPRQLKKGSGAVSTSETPAKEHESAPASVAVREKRDQPVSSGADDVDGSNHTRQNQADDLDEEEEDIFADAGRWTGLDADDDEDDEERRSKAVEPNARGKDAADLPLLPALSASGKRDWFGDGEEEEDRKEEPAASLQPPVHVSPSRQQTQTDAEQPNAPEASTGRLQGLSDSALPSSWSRHLLEQEREREARAERKKEEARRERVNKKREKKRAEREGAEGAQGGAGSE